MDRQYVDDRHVVARYLADQLTDEERAGFEAYYVEHPDVVQEMEAAARFKVGLMHLRETGELDPLLRPASRPQVRNLAAVAAAAVLAVGLLFALTRTPEPGPLLAASVDALRAAGGAPPVIAARHAILRTRGSAVDAELVPSPAGQAIELHVLPEFTAEPARYRVELHRMTQGETPLAELAGLVPGTDGFVVVFLDGSRLEAGRYELTIAGEPDTDARDKHSTFVVRVTAR